jgi:hypothetical protein
MINNISPHSGGGEAAIFKTLCIEMAVMEKFILSEGATPQFGYKNRARLAKVIAQQNIPLQDAKLLASEIVTRATDAQYITMTISDWCGYAVTSCQRIKQNGLKKH